jgi:hypothetical protein
MTNFQIKEYIYSLGEVAARLYDIEVALYKTKPNDRIRLEKKLSELHELFNNNPEAKLIVVQLSRNSTTDIREVAAMLIRYLWFYGKYLPYDSNNRLMYEKDMQAYARSLSWTIPLIKSFILDKATYPVIKSLYDIWEMKYASNQEIELIRDSVLSIVGHKSSEVRKNIVRTLVDYYPINDEALHILDKRALEFYINSSYDSDEQIRDWSLFVLSSSIENVNDETAKAFIAAFNRESQQSEAYVEALVGLARMGLEYERILPLITINLSNEGCGTGWIDAAEQVHSGELLEGIIEMYERITKIDQDDNRLQSLEIALRDWND